MEPAGQSPIVHHSVQNVSSSDRFLAVGCQMNKGPWAAREVEEVLVEEKKIGKKGAEESRP